MSIIESWAGFAWFLVISFLLFLTLCWLQAQWKNDPSSTISHHIPSMLCNRRCTQGEPGSQQGLHRSSHLWCIKVCKKFKAPFHLLSPRNASSLDYKWQPHLHVKAEETREITCPFWAVPEEGKMPFLKSTVQTWGIDQSLCLKSKLLVARSMSMVPRNWPPTSCCLQLLPPSGKVSFQERLDSACWL